MNGKHRGEMRDVVALGPEPAVALILEPGDLPLIEAMLMEYANTLYFPGWNSHRWRGFSMRHQQARALALKVRRMRRGE